MIEEAPEDDNRSSLNEKLPRIDEEAEEAISPTDAAAGTSFNEKSDKLHGHQADVVNIHPDDHSPNDEDGQGLL